MKRQKKTSLIPRVSDISPTQGLPAMTYQSTGLVLGGGGEGVIRICIPIFKEEKIALGSKGTAG